MKNTTNSTLDQREADHAIKNYSRVPNMLVDGYSELLPQDKWLFVCLIRLCGKEGTRHLSLRYIADRTGFTPSVLSDNKGKPGMLKRLHNAGLIHAEIKRKKKADGTEEKNAQYHITIADTWRLNYDFFHPETCSESEQVDKKPVRNQNETCSESEQVDKKPVRNQNETCSESGAIVRLQDKITESDKITERKKEPTAKSTEDSFSHSSIPQSSFENSSFSSETKEEIVTLSAEEQVVYELGSQTIFKVKRPKITPTVKGYCAEIAKAGVTTLDKMESLVAFTKQEKHLIGKTLYLGNLVNALNGWLLSQQQHSQSSAKSRPHTPYILDHKRNEERKAALLAEFEALEAQ
jgi:hypothetical protein